MCSCVFSLIPRVHHIYRYGLELQVWRCRMERFNHSKVPIYLLVYPVDLCFVCACPLYSPEGVFSFGCWCLVFVFAFRFHSTVFHFLFVSVLLRIMLLVSFSRCEGIFPGIKVNLLHSGRLHAISHLLLATVSVNWKR